MERKYYCECGCGQEVTIYRGKPRRFIAGHQSKNMSEETKLKMSKARMGHPGYNKGMKMSEETKLKMSLAQKGKTFTSEHREKIRQARVGKKHTEESIEKMRINSMKDRTGFRGYCDIWFDPEYKKDCRKDYCEECGATMNEVTLVLHHIDENKLNCKPDNLKTLCQACHARLHMLEIWQERRQAMRA